MSHTVTETSSFSASVTVPNPGESVTAASIETAIQPLCNRTQALVDGKITVKSGVTFLGNAGCDWTNNGNTTLTGVACQSIAMNASGTITIPSTGSLTNAGKSISSGRRVRGARVPLTATTQTVNVSQGNRFELASNTSGSAKVITLKSTAPNVPDANETIEFICRIPGDGYTFKREDATIVASFVDNGTLTNFTCHAEFEFSSSVFRLGINSGSSYDGVAAFGVLPGSGA